MTALSEEELRFQTELEFVQCLCNPTYLQCAPGARFGFLLFFLLTGSTDLAQGQYFDEPAFVKYLAYLLYWKQAEYAQFLVYPQCLHFLELLVRRSAWLALRLTWLQTFSKPRRFGKNSPTRSSSSRCFTGSSSIIGALTKRIA